MILPIYQFLLKLSQTNITATKNGPYLFFTLRGSTKKTFVGQKETPKGGVIHSIYDTTISFVITK